MAKKRKGEKKKEGKDVKVEEREKKEVKTKGGKEKPSPIQEEPEKAPEGKDVCIVDGEEIEKGYRVKEDFVIRTIRRIKGALGMLRNNRLYVCEKHLEEYKKKRKNYRKR